MGCRLIVIWEENDTSKYRRGDVVSALPAGAFPGKKVLSDPRFMVIDTDMTQAEAEAYCVSPESESDYRRMKGINLTGVTYGADPISVPKESLRDKEVIHGG